jgi:hypothetical protein
LDWLRLRDVADQFAGFETRGGRAFEQFAAEWEALTTARRERLDLIRELSAPAVGAS